MSEERWETIQNQMYDLGVIDEKEDVERFIQLDF